MSAAVIWDLVTSLLLLLTLLYLKQGIFTWGWVCGYVTQIYWTHVEKKTRNLAPAQDSGGTCCLVLGISSLSSGQHSASDSSWGIQPLWPKSGSHPRYNGPALTGLMTEDWKRGRQCDDFVRLQERYQYSKFLILVRGYPAWIRPSGNVTRANYTFLASSSRLSLRRFNIYLNQSRGFQRDVSQHLRRHT